MRYPIQMIFAAALVAAAWPVVAADPPREPGKHESKSDAAKKESLLKSPRWQRAVAEMNQWLDTQKVYTPDRVTQIRNELNAQVREMSAAQLQEMLDGMEAKLKVLMSPDALEAQAWLGQYMSVMSIGAEKALQKKIPDIAKLSATELAAQFKAATDRRESIQQSQAQFDRTRQAQVRATMSADAAADRTPNSYAQPLTPRPSQYQGTYSMPFSNVRPAPGPSYSVGADGSFYVNYGPHSF